MQFASFDSNAPVNRLGQSVRFSGVAKHYGSTVAVAHVDLEIKTGEFLTLLGASGSGKTTTLMMLAGFEQPTKGEIYVGDRPITLVPPAKRNIGMVFQSYALFPHMTVAENVAFPLRMRRIPKAEQAPIVERVLEIVGLGHLGGRYPRQLSGGQQQRVALARAIVFEPPVLLMDEPLGALDKHLRAHLQTEIRRIQQRLGLTVVYVTHDQEEALTMSDRICVMQEGRIVQLGSPEDLYDRPADTFVANFFGESNFLQAVTTDGGCAVTTDGARLDLSVADGVAAGREISIAVRPERISVRPLGGYEGGEEAMVKGSVVEVVFVGDHRRYCVRISENVSITVKQPISASPLTLPAGERVALTWSKDAMRVFIDGRAAA